MNCFHRQQFRENERKCVPLVTRSVTLVKICYFFYNWFPLVSVTVSNRRKNLWTKKRFPLAGKSSSTSQNEGFHWSRRFHSKKKNYQYFLITLMISNSSKTALTKKNTVSVDRKSVCTSRKADTEKYASILKNILKKKSKKKMVSTGRNNFPLGFHLISMMLSASRKKVLESVPSQNNQNNRILYSSSLKQIFCLAETVDSKQQSFVGDFNIWV